ncbi:MAG: DNA repair protein RecO [Eggerthellaceae bacterium]|nr:DNA repair protein RecO [Eggerthellaceae bacterium]
MARPSYQCTVLTLSKTKLGESDLIITGLKQDGSLLRGVAKGARKPTNPFASRLDIFSISECLLAKGKNLDVFSEARAVQPNLNVREDIALSMASYPIVQALSKTCQEGIEAPRVFEMTKMALSTMDSSTAENAPSITAAFLLKLIALQGFRPSLTHCACCGEEIDLTQLSSGVSFSYLDGGSMCEACAHVLDVVHVPAATLAWCQTLMMSTFKDILDLRVTPDVSFEVLQVCQGWLRQNMGLNLKSLNAMFTYGLW